VASLGCESGYLGKFVPNNILLLPTGNRPIVATFAADLQAILAKDIRSLGEPEDFDIISPPPYPALAPVWQRKWSLGYTMFGARIYFGLEEVNGRELLIYASRKFVGDQSAR
jgi:hypothetical protein